MSITCNSVPVIAGRLTLRLYGAWEADLTVTSSDASKVTGAATIQIGNTSFSGTSFTGGADEGGLVAIRVVGGGGGLGTKVSPTSYDGGTRRQVLDGVLAHVNERLSNEADASVLDAIRPHWVSVAATAGDIVSLVADMAGVTWRTLKDGTIWIGKDTWAPIDEKGLVLENEDKANDGLTYALEEPTLFPGSAINGQHITTVSYVFDESSLRAEVSFGLERAEIEELLGTFVQRETLRLDYHGSYLAKCVAQNGDKTLELVPVDERWERISKVPFRPGIPGLTNWQLAPQTEVVFGFEDGSPEKPIVTSIAPSPTPLILTIAATELRLGDDNATNHPMLAELWAAVHNGHVHTSAAPGSPTSAPTVPAFAAMVQSNTVKIAS